MIEQIIGTLNWTQILLFFITAIGSALAVWYRQKIKSWRTFWMNIFDGLKKIPDLEGKVKNIHQYVSPNGGSSIIDTVKRTEQSVKALDDKVSILSDIMRAENDSDDSIGRYHCSPEGDNIYVNQTYARMLKVGKQELMGWNYLNYIHPEDVNRVRSHWDQCREERRQYRNQHRMIPSISDNSINRYIEVETVASPIPEKGEPRIWIGTIKVLKKAQPLSNSTSKENSCG